MPTILLVFILIVLINEFIRQIIINYRIYGGFNFIALEKCNKSTVISVTYVNKVTLYSLSCNVRFERLFNFSTN